jgi:predicted ATPase
MSASPSNEVLFPGAEAQAKPPFLRRVRIRGYKSIAFCDVTLEPLTILVGRNASGKSNFLDALAFLRDVVVLGAHEAVKFHGGRDAIPCRLTDTSRVSIEIEASYLPQRETEPWIGRFGIEIDFPQKSVPRIVRQHLCLENAKGFRQAEYTVVEGRVSWGEHSSVHPVNEWPNADRVLLGMYGVTPFLELLELLESIETYNFNPEAIRQPRKPAPGGFLERDGSNLASTIETTREVEEWAIERASRYLAVITKTAEFAGVVRSAGYETLRFRVSPNGTGEPLEFDAASMSDGTLRAFAALVAAFQMALPHGYPGLVGIEEPETALHPAAMRALVDALDEATLRTQILLTTHSADMLDNPTIRPENVRVVQMIDGRTVIGPVDEASVEIVARKLDTLGGLERQNQLEPDLDEQDRQRQLSQDARGRRGCQTPAGPHRPTPDT